MTGRRKSEACKWPRIELLKLLLDSTRFPKSYLNLIKRRLTMFEIPDFVFAHLSDSNSLGDVLCDVFIAVVEFIF